MSFLQSPSFSRFVQTANPNSIETVGHFMLKTKLPNAGIGSYCDRSGNGMCTAGRQGFGILPGVFPSGISYRSPGLGAISDYTGSIATVLGLGLAGLFGYQLLFGSAAKSRRRLLKQARGEYTSRVRQIRRKYPRHSFYAMAGE